MRLALSVIVLVISGCGSDAVERVQCANGTKDGQEADVDCGGPCPACPDGKACTTDANCASGVCRNGRCTAPSCDDSLWNGAESDADCGGPACEACPAGGRCRLDSDCLSRRCADAQCGLPPCEDGTRDGTETDVDCGGGVCAKCADGLQCTNNADCASGTCFGKTCRAMLQCAPGRANCDMDPDNGCEVSTLSDPSNCGDCGTTCPPRSPICANGACQALPRVLVLHSASDTDALKDIGAVLMATKAFDGVDFIDTSRQHGTTPTVAALKAYQAVLFWSYDSILDPTTLGDNLADYHDGGGRVVVAYQYNDAGPSYYLGGRFGAENGGYLLIAPGDNGLAMDSLGAIAEPLSPLLKGVMSLQATGGRCVTHPINGGKVVASWASGEPLVVRGAKNGRMRVDLNLIPASTMGFQFGWSGDGAALLKNALLFQ